MKLVDLSAMIKPGPEGTPPYLRTEIAYHSHAAGAAQAQAILNEGGSAGPARVVAILP